ncbi:MAG: ABC transporter ATP-binding protein [Myxococcales bacterium]|nr:ABC transporter ATP-binding protein [Myxococcales bacterium]
MAEAPVAPGPPKTLRGIYQEVRTAFRQTPRVMGLVWAADARSALGIMLLSFLGALLPLAIAWIGKLIIDGVLAASASDDPAARAHVMQLVGAELGLMLFTGLLGMSTGLLRSLLGTRLGYLINLRILDKARTLDLVHFETPAVYDKLQNARREASSRPLNLFTSAVDVVANVVTLASYGVVLVTFSPLTLLILAAATLPAFIAEARFSGAAFRLFTWRAPEGRRMRYLELLLTRDDSAKEVKLFALGDLLVARYRALYEKFFGEERSLAVRRAAWGFGLGALSTVALYGCYGWIASRAVVGALTLGDMTLYMAVFRQGQAALRTILRAIGGTYEDNLFMSNLFGFLELPTEAEAPAASAPSVAGEGRGFELVDVSFRYPGRPQWVLRHLNLSIGPTESLAIVGENGAGKSTLIKLLAGLYPPTEGVILLDGRPLVEYPREVLWRRFGVVLQDFVRYQFNARENVGLGNVAFIDDLERIRVAAEKGGADETVAGLPNGWDTQLGRWFEGGVELSMGNWQKVAVSRAFMRDADILILDEPTAALDAEAEHALFQRFRALTEGRMALLISHRFSTVRMADRIAVLVDGRVAELGTHEALMAEDGRYARLFTLQAEGYLGAGALAGPR